MSQHIPLEDLSALLDEVLPEARAAQMRAHLTDCAACERELQGLAWARDFLRAAAVPPLPPGIDLRLPLPDAAADQAPATVLPFSGRGAWWGLGAVAALLLLAFMLRPLALQLGLGGPAAGGGTDAGTAGEETQMTSQELSSASSSAPGASPSQLGASVDAMVEAAGTQAVDDERGPTALAPLATARHADQARMVDGPTAVAGAPVAPAVPGAEAGGYIPPEAGISGLGRPDVAMLNQLALAVPRGTATALAALRATLVPSLTEAAPGADTAAGLATLAAADVESGQLLALLEAAGGATMRPPTRDKQTVTPTAAPQPSAGPIAPAAPTAPLAAAIPPDAAAGGGSPRPWVPALALMVALLTLGLLVTVRARRRRRRY